MNDKDRGDSATLLQLSDAVLQRIGRNLLVFQRLEHNIKWLLAHREIKGPVSQLLALHEKNQARINRKTMGTLAESYIDHFRPATDVMEDSNTVTEATIMVSFRVESDPGHVAAKRQDLARLVADRNELAHTFLQTCVLETDYGCHAAIQRLDEQYGKALVELHDVRRWAQMLSDSYSQYHEYLASPDAALEFELAWLRGSPLSVMLAEIAEQEKRPDGWMVLDKARQIIRNLTTDDVGWDHKEQGHKTLRSFLLATDLFDLHDQPTAKGGTRLLYRMKSNSGQPP